MRSPSDPTGALDAPDAMQPLVAALLRATRDLAALDRALAIADDLAEQPLSPPDRALLADAVGYIRTRAILQPSLRSRAFALAERLVKPPPVSSSQPAPATGICAETRGAITPHALPLDRIARACGWIDRHLDRFRVDAARTLPSIKALGELAHAGEVLARCDDPQLAARGRAWIDHAWRALDGGAVIAARIEATAHDALLATVLPPFVRAGHRDAALLAQIAAQVERTLFTPIEWALLVPVLRELGLAVPAVGEQTAARASILATRPSPWTLDLGALYQLAHEVFYATAWGRDRYGRASAGPSRARSNADPSRDRALDFAGVAYVRRWLARWVELYAADPDVDIVAELVATATCLDCAVPDAGWDLLATAQADDGSQTPPAHRRADGGLDDARGIDDATDDDAFTRRCHPTLVTVIAWAM